MTPRFARTLKLALNFLTPHGRRPPQLRALAAASLGVIAGLSAAACLEDQAQAAVATEAVAATPDPSPPSSVSASASASTDAVKQQDHEERDDEDDDEAEEERREAAEDAAEEREEELEEEAEDACRRGPSAFVGDRGKRSGFGGYGGLTFLGTKVRDKAELLVGLEGGMLINRRLALGLAGFALTSESNGMTFPNGSESVLGFGYGGLSIRHQFVGKGPIYLSAGALIGAGLITLLERQEDGSLEYNDETRAANGFFVFEPSLQVHANLTHWMRLGINGSYRLVHGVTIYDYEENDLRGFAFGAHVQFGWF